MVHSNTKHGQADTALYRVWGNMKHRCSSKAIAQWEDYGGRGISVCEEWKTFPPFFEWAHKSGYREGLSIDRIDNDGNYEPGNCQWSTVKEQARNRRSGRYLTAWGESKLAAEWADDLRCRVTYNRLIARVGIWGWDVERAITTPPHREVTAWGETRAIAEWAKDDRCLVAYSTLNTRIRLGWEPEDALTIRLRSPHGS